MADLVHIDDPSDPRLGDYTSLTDATLRKRYEHQHGVFIAEGPNPVRELLASPYRVRSLLLAEERVAAMTDVLDAVDVPAYVVRRTVLYEAVRFPLHQGVLACGDRRPLPTVEEVVADAHRLLVLEGLNDHENLGTLFRSARGLGGEGVLLGPGCADPLYRRSVRVSMGHVLRLPFTRTPGSTAALLADLRHRGVVTVALTPGAAAIDLRDLPPATLDAPVALVLGAEGPGLTDAALEHADVRVRIPMRDGVDSLNVAAAGAIALHALAPRRRETSPHRAAAR